MKYLGEIYFALLLIAIVGLISSAFYQAENIGLICGISVLILFPLVATFDEQTKTENK